MFLVLTNTGVKVKIAHKKNFYIAPFGAGCRSNINVYCVLCKRIRRIKKNQFYTLCFYSYWHVLAGIQNFKACIYGVQLNKMCHLI